MWLSFPVTAAGPFLILTGFPLNCNCSTWNIGQIIVITAKCQEKFLIKSGNPDITIM